MAPLRGLMKLQDGHQRCLVLLLIQGTFPSLQMVAALGVPHRRQQMQSIERRGFHGEERHGIHDAEARAEVQTGNAFLLQNLTGPVPRPKHGA